MPAVVELQGLRPERPSAPAGLLPDIPEPLVSHRAICSERTAAWVVIPAPRALLQDIGLCIIRDSRIVCGDAPKKEVASLAASLASGVSLIEEQLLRSGLFAVEFVQSL
jgi:hypothetical protein